MTNPHTVRASVDGETYEIPELWLVGGTRAFGTAEAAIRHWHEQVQLAAAHRQGNICPTCDRPAALDIHTGLCPECEGRLDEQAGADFGPEPRA